MPYNINDEYLCHFMTKRKKHKYIARIEKPNNKAIYFYKLSDYKKYLNKKDTEIKIEGNNQEKSGTIDKKKYEPFDFSEIEKSIQKLLKVKKEEASKNAEISKKINENLEKAMSEQIKDFKEKDDPNKDKYDNSYTDEECLKNARSGMDSTFPEWRSSISETYNEISEKRKEKKEKMTPSMLDTDEGLIEAVSYIYDRKENEPISLLFQRAGLMDESLDGYHPKSFDDLNKIEDETVDNVSVVNDGRFDLYKMTDKNDDAKIDDLDYDKMGYMNKHEYNYGYSHNCAYCSLAYEMRERGYDVEASYVSQYKTSNTTTVIESWYKDGSFTDMDSGTNIQDIEKQILNSQPEGSRGTMNLSSFFSGHSVAYVIENGKVQIIDAQVGEKLPIEQYAWFKNKNYSEINVEYMRTDTLEFTDNALIGVKNRKR